MTFDELLGLQVSDPVRFQAEWWVSKLKELARSESWTQVIRTSSTGNSLWIDVNDGRVTNLTGQNSALSPTNTTRVATWNLDNTFRNTTVVPSRFSEEQRASILDRIRAQNNVSQTTTTPVAQTSNTFTTPSILPRTWASSSAFTNVRRPVWPVWFEIDSIDISRPKTVQSSRFSPSLSQTSNNAFTPSQPQLTVTQREKWLQIVGNNSDGTYQWNDGRSYTVSARGFYKLA